MAKSKAIADLVKSLNATLKARSMAGKVEPMTKKVSVLDDVFTPAGNRLEKYKPRAVTVEDDFVTTAANMDFRKSGLNASTYNKRRLLRAVENWNKNKKYDYFRGENTRSSRYRPKDLNSPEGKRFLEAEESVLKDMVNSGFNRGITGGRKPVKDKYQREFRDAFFSNNPRIADAYSRSNMFGIPVIKKIRLNKEQIQKGMERNFESNTAAGQDDIILQRDLLEKATRSFWRGIMRKFQKYNNGGRANYRFGGLTKSLLKKLNTKKIKAAVDNIFPSGDYKYDAEMAAESLVEMNPKLFGGQLYDDLDDMIRSDVYGLVLKELSQRNALKLQARRAAVKSGTVEEIIPEFKRESMKLVDGVTGKGKPFQTFETTTPPRQFKLNVEKAMSELNIPREEAERIARLSSDEQKAALDIYLNRNTAQQVDLMNYNPKKFDAAKGGLAGVLQV